MLEITLPVTVAVFFLGLVLTIRFALPRWKDTKALTLEVMTLRSTVTAMPAVLQKLEERMDTAEKNIQTLHGNLVTVRDQVQFKGIAASLRGGQTK